MLSKLAHSCEETMEQIERNARAREEAGQRDEPPETEETVRLLKAISDLKRYQRHHLLRQYGDDGHVLPECLEISAAIDTILARVH